MNLDAWHRLSLRQALLLVLLPGCALVVAAEGWLTWRGALDAANAAYDRSLLGAIKAMDANLSTESGGLSVELPYRMLEFFELTASGQVYYRVATEDKLVEIGNADLPAPPGPLRSGQPRFSDAVYFDQPVRVGSYARELGGRMAGRRVVIQVAETLASRNAFARSLVLQSLQRSLVLVLAAGALLALAIGWALRPLRRLHDEVQARSPQDLTAMDGSRIPADVRPLVDAINHHVARNRELTEARRRFIDDASHQLRTPLATLNTQLAYALRETDTDLQRQALQALKTGLDDTVRQTNQMLALARTDAVAPVAEAVDLVALAADLTRQHWRSARDQGLDLGLETPFDTLPVQAHASLLKEALANLLHNALRYTPAPGRVTVTVAVLDGTGQPADQASAADSTGLQALLAVHDTGPGIPTAELPRAGERFFRASNASQPGSGLGLAIVAAIAQRHGGRLQLQAGPGGQGLEARLVWPLQASAAAPATPVSRPAA